MFVHKVGALGGGNDLAQGMFTLESAQEYARGLDGCVGFTFFGEPEPDGEVEVFFKSSTEGNEDPAWQTYYAVHGGWGLFAPEPEAFEEGVPPELGEIHGVKFVWEESGGSYPELDGQEEHPNFTVVVNVASNQCNGEDMHNMEGLTWQCTLDTVYQYVYDPHAKTIKFWQAGADEGNYYLYRCKRKSMLKNIDGKSFFWEESGGAFPEIEAVDHPNFKVVVDLTNKQCNGMDMHHIRGNTWMCTADVDYLYEYDADEKTIKFTQAGSDDSNYYLYRKSTLKKIDGKSFFYAESGGFPELEVGHPNFKVVVDFANLQCNGMDIHHVRGSSWQCTADVDYLYEYDADEKTIRFTKAGGDGSDTFLHKVGALGGGNDLAQGMFTLESAQEYARGLDGCVGFTFFGEPEPDGEVEVFFKSSTEGNEDPAWQTYYAVHGGDGSEYYLYRKSALKKIHGKPFLWEESGGGFPEIADQVDHPNFKVLVDYKNLQCNDMEMTITSGSTWQCTADTTYEYEYDADAKTLKFTQAGGDGSYYLYRQSPLKKIDGKPFLWEESGGAYPELGADHPNFKVVVDFENLLCFQGEHRAMNSISGSTWQCTADVDYTFEYDADEKTIKVTQSEGDDSNYFLYRQSLLHKISGEEFMWESSSGNFAEVTSDQPYFTLVVDLESMQVNDKAMHNVMGPTWKLTYDVSLETCFFKTADQNLELTEKGLENAMFDPSWPVSHCTMYRSR
eukprot:COSAG01_NODE_1689_length_9488_cov_5.759825_12_plen_731_part_00